MKHVCFVLTTPFAVNAFLLGHIRALADSYHVTLCVNTSLYSLSPLVDARVKVVSIGIQRKISPLSDFDTLLNLMRLFWKMRFDAIHSMTPKAGFLAMLAAFFVRIKCRHHTFTGQVWANKSGCKRFFFKAIDKVIVATATRVFSDSESQCRFLEVEGIVKCGEATVLGSGSICGVDFDRFHPDSVTRINIRSALKVAENACVFLFVGRVVRDKGIFDLVNAFSKLSERHENVVLWVVGPDEDGLLVELKKLLPSSEERVFWLGPTFQPESYMAAADVLVLPSYREGFGMVIVEGAASGIPSIAYQIAGVIDAVENGETGILVPKGDVGELAEAMRSFVEDASFRLRLGKKAREHAKQNFSSTMVTGAWMEFYRNEFS